jgi:hypothetical protein
VSGVQDTRGYGDRGRGGKSRKSGGRVSLESVGGFSKSGDYKLSTQDFSPKKSTGVSEFSRGGNSSGSNAEFTGHNVNNSKKSRHKKNVSMDSRAETAKLHNEGKKPRKVKSARTSVIENNDFYPKEMQNRKEEEPEANPGSKTTPVPLMVEREDYSYKIQNELTRDEIEGYEVYIKRPKLNGEEFVQFISTPLKKKSALELGLSEKKAQGFYLKSMTVKELMEEKNKVKNELKYYDKIFIKKVGKPPSNREKEPLK